MRIEPEVVCAHGASTTAEVVMKCRADYDYYWTASPSGTVDADGAFEVEVNGHKRILKTGDAFIAPHEHTHGVVALEDKSTLLDQFSPRRDDYLTT
jgi:hypothetical protein